MEAWVSNSFKVSLGVVLLGLMLAGCGGGSSMTTLHGTFTDTSQFLDPGSGACTDQESGSQVSVKVTVDNVAAGSTNVTFGSGKPVNSGIITVGTGAKWYSCAGTWSITIPSAHIGYSLSVGGLSGNVTVSVSKAGSSVQLNNGTAGTNLYEGAVQPNT